MHMLRGQLMRYPNPQIAIREDSVSLLVSVLSAGAELYLHPPHEAYDCDWRIFLSAKMVGCYAYGVGGK